jgi:hypothetical protein
MDARRAPKHILNTHPSDQRPQTGSVSFVPAPRPPGGPNAGGLNMKLLLLLALLLTLDACQNPGRFQAPQIGPLTDSKGATEG